MLSFQQQGGPAANVVQALQSTSDPDHNPHRELQSDIDQQLHMHKSQTIGLREGQPVPTPATSRSSRKRKPSPSNNINNDPLQISSSQVPQIQVPPNHLQMSPHTMMHTLQTALPTYPYAPSDYSPAGLPADHSQASDGTQQAGSQSPQNNNSRALGSSKRAEQNRKAQRAFRERRDQHVKALESRSQLLDAALASADEANRRWEECRSLVDQLRLENAALRAALSQAQHIPGVKGLPNLMQQERKENTG